jgi:hypothetical protein
MDGFEQNVGRTCAAGAAAGALLSCVIVCLSHSHVGHGARGGHVHASQEAGCQDNVEMSRVGEGVLVVRVQRAAQPGCPLRIRYPVRTTRPTA